MPATGKFTMKCAFCRQDYNRLNVLVCNHKLCEQCYKTRKKSGKTVECPILNCTAVSDAKLIKTREYKTFADTLVSMNEKSLLNSVQEYQTILNEQEVNLERQIYNIEKQLNVTSESIDKNRQELNALFEKRQKELKEHFTTLKDDMIAMGVKRKEQLNCILSIINELKDQLQKQRTWFADIVKKNANKMDFGTLQSDIEDKMSHMEIIDMDIPKLDITIVPNDEWTMKDSLTISAPDPTMLRKKLKMMTKVELDLLDIPSKRLTKINKLAIPEQAQSVSILKDIVYCDYCDFKSMVTMNTTLSDKRCIDAGDMGKIYAVEWLYDSTLIVAAYNGLYHISPRGKQLTKVAKGEHTQVSCHDTAACTMHSNNDTPSTITLYTYNDKQFTKTNSFQLPFSSQYVITTVLGKSVIYVSNPDEDCIYVFSQDGTVLNKHGRSGRSAAGELKCPLAAATDEYDNLLVCDGYNNRLQVMSNKGKWFVLESDVEIEFPKDAAIVDGKIFVVGGSKDNYISVFDIPK